jgi:transposase
MPPHSAAQWHAGAKLVRRWITRLNMDELRGLADQPRSGRPATSPPVEAGRVVATALTNPQELGQPFGSWIFERVPRYLNEVCQIPIQHSRVQEILQEEGLRWREQETWFGARVDPAFAPGAIEILCQQPPDHSAVICLDEMGPKSAKSDNKPSRSPRDQRREPNTRLMMMRRNCFSAVLSVSPSCAVFINPMIHTRAAMAPAR